MASLSEPITGLLAISPFSTSDWFVTLRPKQYECCLYLEDVVDFKDCANTEMLGVRCHQTQKVKKKLHQIKAIIQANLFSGGQVVIFHFQVRLK